MLNWLAVCASVSVLNIVVAQGAVLETLLCLEQLHRVSLLWAFFQLLLSGLTSQINLLFVHLRQLYYELFVSATAPLLLVLCVC